MKSIFKEGMKNASTERPQSYTESIPKRGQQHGEATGKLRQKTISTSQGENRFSSLEAQKGGIPTSQGENGFYSFVETQEGGVLATQGEDRDTTPSTSDILGSRRALYLSNLKDRCYEQGTVANITFSVLRRDRKHISIIEVYQAYLYHL